MNRSSGSIHKALDLPGTYRVGIAVEGRIGDWHYSLRQMASETGGTTLVHAVAVNWGKWKEISQEEMNRLANKVINGPAWKRN